MTSNKTLHANLRKTLTPYFDEKACKAFIPSFTKIAEKRVNIWLANRVAIDMTTEIGDFIVDVVIHILFQGESTVNPTQAINFVTEYIGKKMIKYPNFLLNQTQMLQSKNTIDQFVNELLDESNSGRSCKSND